MRQSVRNSVNQLIELSEMLNWPIITTPQAKGYIQDDHPFLAGVYGFAGHEAASALIDEGNEEVLLIVVNNARLGMVYHGHELQFHRSHPTFVQEAINITAMAAAMNIPSFRVAGLEDINQDIISNFMNLNGPAALEIALVDNNIPQMGDRVKFLSTFRK